MPFPGRVNPNGPLGLRRQRFHVNAVEGPTHNASQCPVQDADDQNHFVRGAGKVAKKNVHQRDRSQHDSQAKPPDNPPTNPNMNVMHFHTSDYWTRRDPARSLLSRRDGRKADKSWASTLIPVRRQPDLFLLHLGYDLGSHQGSNRAAPTRAADRPGKLAQRTRLARLGRANRARFPAGRARSATTCRTRTRDCRGPESPDG
jgi:hypothetical protein